MFILATLSPAVRLFPTICSRYGGTAGWLAPVVGAVVPAVIITVLYAIFKNGRVRGLGEAFEAAFGKWPAKLLLIAYIAWTGILFLLYVRYYAERLTSSLFTSSGPDFFIIAMFILVFYAARAKITALARFSEISMLVFAVVFAVFFVSLLPTWKVQNVMPVTYHDALPVLRSVYPVVGIWGFITLFFFLDGHIENMGDIKKHARNMILIIAGTTALMMFMVVGSLGPDTAARMPLPFFKVSKLIDIMQSFDRFEAVLSSMLVIADFILITVFVFVISSLVKKLFGLSESRYLAGPVVMLGYAGSLLISSSAYELERFSANPLTHAVNLTFCLVIPVLALAAGRVRRLF